MAEGAQHPLPSAAQATLIEAKAESTQLAAQLQQAQHAAAHGGGVPSAAPAFAPLPVERMPSQRRYSALDVGRSRDLNLTFASPLLTHNRHPPVLLPPVPHPPFGLPGCAAGPGAAPPPTPPRTHKRRAGRTVRVTQPDRIPRVGRPPRDKRRVGQPNSFRDEVGVAAVKSGPWPLAGARSVEWLYLEPAWKGVVGAVVVLGLVAAGLLVRGRSGRVVRVGLLWIAVSSAPLVVPIVNTGQLGERYLYLPLVGVALVVGALWKDRPLWLAAPVLLAWVATINLRLPDWQNDRTLWSAAAEQLGSPGALAGLAHIDRLEGRNVQALAGFQEALDAPIPDWSACTPLVGTALSLERVVLAGQLGRWAEQRGCGSSPEAGSFLGVWALALARSGDWQGARALRAGAPEDDRGRGAVVDLALALVDHDAARAEALTRRWEGRFDIEAQAAQLLAERDSTTMLQGP